MLVIRNYVCCCAGMGVVQAGSIIVQHSTVQQSKVQWQYSTITFLFDLRGWRLEVTSNYVLYNNYCKVRVVAGILS